MDQQAQIQHGRTVVERGRIQHEDQAPIAPEGEERAEEMGPHREHGDLVVGQKARQAALDAGRLGGTDANERLRDSGQARCAGEHDAQDEEGQRFAAVPMHLGHHRTQVAPPLAPQRFRCVHIAERSFPMTRFSCVLAWYWERFFLATSAFLARGQKVSGREPPPPPPPDDVPLHGWDGVSYPCLAAPHAALVPHARTARCRRSPL